VYAFGATLFEMLSRRVPFRTADTIVDLERMDQEQPALFHSPLRDGSVEQALRTLALPDISQEDAESASRAALEMARKIASDANGHELSEADDDQSAPVDQLAGQHSGSGPAGESTAPPAEADATGLESASAASPSAPETDVEGARAHSRGRAATSTDADFDRRQFNSL
jgi:hypothetical protein